MCVLLLYLTSARGYNGRFTNYIQYLFKQLTAEVTMGSATCFDCEKTFDDSFVFCPHCLREKGAHFKEMKLKDAYNIPMNSMHLKMEQLVQKNQVNISNYSFIIFLRVLRCWN
jgi:hypothetical protein